MIADRLSHSKYTVRKKVLRLFGGAFQIYDPMGRAVFYSEQKAFKLKEDIRLYTGEDKETEVLLIKARQIIDFSSAYDVVDSSTNEKVGALKRKGFKSMFRDEWVFMDPSDHEIGSIREDSVAMALVRRLLLNLIPQTYRADIGGVEVCTFEQNFNPFVTKITVDFSQNTNGLLDKRLGLSAALLLTAIEGKQN